MQSPEPLPRPSTSRPEFAEQARKLALARTSDEAPARSFEIARATHHAWLESVPAFARPELERLAATGHDDGTRGGRRR